MNADATLAASYRRMLFRTTPEVAGGGSLRSDPQAWAWHLQAGAAMPFWKRHALSALAWHDSSQDWHANQVVGSNVLSKSGTVTGLGLQLLLGRPRRRRCCSAPTRATRRRRAATRTASTSSSAGRAFTSARWPKGAANLGQHVNVNIASYLNEQWNEAPITVHEGGTMTGATGHLYLYPKSRVVLFDGGAQARQLRLSQEGTPEPPKANQLLVWGGDRLQPVGCSRPGSCAPKRSTNGSCGAPT